MKTMKEKVESSEADQRLQKRLVERAGQPQSYLLTEVERAERELEMTHRKIKAQDEQLKRLRSELD